MKTILITGANSGIGNALAKVAIANNYYVIGTSRNGKIDTINENIFVVELDVTDSNSIENAKKLIRKKFNTIDVLVNNAGIAPDLDTIIPNQNCFKDTFDTNVTGIGNAHRIIT